MRLLLTASLLTAFAASAGAQSLEVVHAFPAKVSRPVSNLLELFDGVFLGTSSAGGAYDKGTIYVLYRRADSTWDDVVVHSFSGPDGATPMAGLIRASDGNFYGTTQNGGANQRGTVFRMTPLGQVTTLHAFAGPDGEYPERALVQAPDGRLWGTTSGGGASQYGTVFRVSLGGSFTVMRSFFADANGAQPQSLVVGSDGRLYGTTALGGTNPLFGGTVFRVTTAGAFTTLRSFADSNEKWISRGGDGRIYGMSRAGGPTSRGFSFRVTPATGVVDLLFPFDAPGASAAEPLGAPIQAPDGSFFGIARHDPTHAALGDGVVYRIGPTAIAQRVATLGGSLGIFPRGLVLASDGQLYGTTETGERPLIRAELGPNGQGAAFSLPPSGPATLLRQFSDEAPSGPAGPLVEGSSGSLYGTSCYGGIYNRGTVFRLDGTAVTTIHSFNGADGACPASGLTIGPDGALYGTTFLGFFGDPLTLGASVFRITTGGEFRVLWETDQNSGYRWALAAPTVGPDGQLYVPLSNIFGGLGAIVRLTTDGDLTMEVPLGNSEVTGTWPAGRLLLGPDGHLYGTSSSGTGGVFRMTTDGTFEPVHLFEEASDLRLRTGVILGSDGRLYGAAMTDGSTGAGRLYAMTLDGDPTILHEFAFTDGALPWGDLLEVGPGEFMGLTHAFGQQDYGTLFTVRADGSFSTLHHFGWLDGANPFGGLMRTASGDVYGATHRGGPLGGGVIFRLVDR